MKSLLRILYIISVLQSLDDPNANTFMNLLEENGNAEKAMEFARKKIPDFEAKVREKICYELKHIYY